MGAYCRLNSICDLQLLGDGVLISLDNLEEVPRPSLEAVIVPRWDVGHQVDDFPLGFGVGQLFNEPFECGVGVTLVNVQIAGEER